MTTAKKTLRGRGWRVAIVVCGIVAFSSALVAPFVFDDIPAIDRNQSIRHLLSASVLDPPRDTPVAGRPVVNASLAINHAINEAFGIEQDSPTSDPLRTASYHFLNIFIHCVNGLLLFAVIRRLVRLVAVEWPDADRIAGISALLWLLHPIQTEAVDYTIQRTELLVSCFYLLTLYCAIRAHRTSSVRWDAAAIAACAAGMASKEVMLTAPPMLALLDRAFLHDSWRAIRADRRRVRLYAGLFATSLIVVAYTAAGVRSKSVGYGLGVTTSQYLTTQAWAVARYLRLLLWPAGLTFDYGDAPISGLRPLIGAAIIGACLCGIVFTWRRAWRWLAFAGVWFFLLLVPSSSIVPIKTEIAADRRVYLASAGIFVMLAVAVEFVGKRFDLGRRTITVATACGCIVLIAATFGRGLTFRSAVSLYADVVEKAPTNPRGYVGLGLAEAQHGPAAFPEAAANFRKAISLDSNSFDAWQSLGILSVVDEQWTDAVGAFREALRLNPENLDADAGMARAEVHLGELDSAARYVDRIGSADPEVLWMLGERLIAGHRDHDAVPFLERSTRAMPHGRGPALLGVALAHIGDTVDAESYLTRALAIESTSALARAELDSMQHRWHGPD